MKPLICTLCLIVAITLSSCQQSTPDVAHIPGVAQNHTHATDVELILSLNQAFLTGDSATMADLLSENFQAYGPEQDAQYNKETEIEAWMAFRDHFKHAELYDQLFYSLIAEDIDGRPELAGKWVFMWANMAFESLEDEKQVRVPVHVAYKIDDGHIRNTITYFDRLSLSQQLGYNLVKSME